MRLARRFIDECARARDPIMFEIPPATSQRVTAHGSYVIVNAKLSARQAFEQNAEASRCDIETAGLNPYSIRVGKPWSPFGLPARCVTQSSTSSKIVAS